MRIPIEGGCLFTELGFRVGFSIKDFRVGFSNKDFFRGFFFGGIFFGGVSNKFSVFFTQRTLSTSRGVFKMEESKDGTSVRAILFNFVFWTENNSWHLNECF